MLEFCLQLVRTYSTRIPSNVPFFYWARGPQCFSLLHRGSLIDLDGSVDLLYECPAGEKAD
jgi:hypothetical protein